MNRNRNIKGALLLSPVWALISALALSLHKEGANVSPISIILGCVSGNPLQQLVPCSVSLTVLCHGLAPWHLIRFWRVHCDIKGQQRRMNDKPFLQHFEQRTVCWLHRGAYCLPPGGQHLWLAREVLQGLKKMWEGLEFPTNVVAIILFVNLQA